MATSGDGPIISGSFQKEGIHLMKMYHALLFYWHKLIRKYHRIPGKWQNAAFQRHHRAMKYHKERASM